MNQLFCKLTGGHRFQGAPDTYIDKHEMVHFRHTCTKCGKICEWVVPWISVWHSIGPEIEKVRKE